MTSTIDVRTEGVVAGGIHGEGRVADGVRAGDGALLPILLSRIASLGVPVLVAAAIERLFRTPPSSLVDIVPSLLLLVAAGHLALLAIVLWLLVEPTGDARRTMPRTR